MRTITTILYGSSLLQVTSHSSLVNASQGRLDIRLLVNLSVLACLLLAAVGIMCLGIRKPKSLWATIPVAAVICIVLLNKAVTITDGIEPRAYNMYGLLRSYVVTHHGVFPESEQELEESGLLRRHISGDKCVFSYRYDPNDEKWDDSTTFHDFHFAYGAQLTEMEIVDGRLVNKVTGEQVFLIDGPYHSYLRDTYEALSEALYRTMVDEDKAWRTRTKMTQPPISKQTDDS